MRVKAVARVWTTVDLPPMAPPTSIRPCLTLIVSYNWIVLVSNS